MCSNDSNNLKKWSKNQIVEIFNFADHPICHTYSYPLLQPKTRYRQYINKWPWLCSNETFLIAKPIGVIERHYRQNSMSPETLCFELDGANGLFSGVTVFCLWGKRKSIWIGQNQKGRQWQKLKSSTLYLCSS